MGPFAQARKQARPAPQVEPVFEVATEGEIEIVQVAGDTGESFVVGNLPLDGPVVLASPGDVTVTEMEPAEDNMVPDMNVDHRPPMIWAKKAVTATIASWASVRSASIVFSLAVRVVL